MDRGWQLLEDRVVVANQPEERRAPRTQCDHVDERQRRHRPAMQQMRAQGRGAADVVRHDGRALKVPEVKEVSEPPPVPRQRHVLLRAPIGRSEPEQVEDVNGEAPCQPPRDAPPRPRRLRGAMDEHDRRPLPEPVPSDLARPGLKALRSTHSATDTDANRSRPLWLALRAAYTRAPMSSRASTLNVHFLLVVRRRRALGGPAIAWRRQPIARVGSGATVSCEQEQRGRLLATRSSGAVPPLGADSG